MAKAREEFYRGQGVPPGPPTMQGVNGEPDRTGNAYPNAPLGSYDVPKTWPGSPRFAEAGGPPGPPIQWDKRDLTSANAHAGDDYANAPPPPENELYYYHTDHLGSTSYITDRQGEVVQFACYLPYGEALADEHTVTDTQPYKFSGKELDSETGLYYFGARYYNPRSAVWYGVDALAEKFPSTGSFVYTFGNPIVFTDPDGRIPWPISKSGNGTGWNTKAGWFGEQRATHVHKGVDINKNTGRDTDLGASVYATHQGKISSVKLYSDHKGGGGTIVTIDSPDGSFQTAYMHLNTVDVEVGDEIAEGQQIGTIGKTGCGVADKWLAHLHYEIRKRNEENKFISINPESENGVLIDPQLWIGKSKQKEKKQGLYIYSGATFLNASPKQSFFQKTFDKFKSLFTKPNSEPNADFWERYENEKNNRKQD